MFELKKIEAEWKARMHKALYFDGVDDYVEVPDSASLNITDEITIEAWIKPSDDSENTIVGKRDAYIFAYSPSWNRRKLYFNYYNGSEWVGGTYSNTKIEDFTKFYHVAATYSRYKGIVRIFINGKLDVENTVTADKIAVNANPVEVGYVWNVWFFNGIIAHVSIYNRALSPSEIKYLYHNPFDLIDPEHLVLWLNPAGIDVANGKWWDLSGKGNHGDIVGATEVKLVEDEVIVK